MVVTTVWPGWERYVEGKVLGEGEGKGNGDGWSDIGISRSRGLGGGGAPGCRAEAGGR